MQIFFHENEQDLQSFASRLERACDGLIFISETDAPVKLFAPSFRIFMEGRAMRVPLSRRIARHVHSVHIVHCRAELPGDKAHSL